MARYRVLAGSHSDFSPDGKFSNMIYKRGDIVLTKSDLGKLNSAGKEDKFQLIPGSEDEVPPVLPVEEQVHSVAEYNLWLEQQKKQPVKVNTPFSGNTPPEGQPHTTYDKGQTNTGKGAPEANLKPKKHTSEELHGKTVAELKELAEEEEIELGGASRKEDIIDAILKAR